jgi:hypothetical protein
VKKGKKNSKEKQYGERSFGAFGKRKKCCHRRRIHRI